MSIFNARLTNILFIFSVSLLVLFISEPAYALNVEKIGKNLAGNEREKMRVIKEIFFYAGVFFTVLGITVLLFVKNKYALLKRNDTSNAAGPFLIIIGLLMMSSKLF